MNWKFNAVLVFTSVVVWNSYGQLSFEDVTDNAGFLKSLPGDTHGSGVAAADYDQDGDIDLYICAEKGHPDLLYENRNGQFVSVGSELGLASVMRGRMALWLDYNGDGLQDLLVSGDCDRDAEDCPELNPLRLYEQQNGIFVDKSVEAGLSGFGAKRQDQTLGGLAAADINLDGWVDFVHVVRNGYLNVFINQRNGTFIESSDSLGFTQNTHKYYQPIFHDFNQDGFIDLYCNVDFGENQLWMNSAEGNFTNLARGTSSNNDFNEMGITLGDIDRDGDLDIYATNISNYLAQDVYNILLQNDMDELGFLSFSERAIDYGIDQSGWDWGTTFFDADNDGWLDLAVTNGWDLPFEVIDYSKFWIGQPDGSFMDASNSVGFNDNFNGNTLISLDYDRDGDLDMIQGLKGFDDPQLPLRLLENKIDDEDRGNYLVVKPRMLGHNHFAIGAIVKVTIGDIELIRLIHSGTSFYGQEPAEAFFGLGEASMVDEISIVWPGGRVSNEWTDVQANQMVELTDENVIHTPTQFRAESFGSSVRLKWNDYASNESGYMIQRAIDRNFTSFESFEIPANLEYYLDQTVLEDQSYYYRIKATHESIESNFTERISIYNVVLENRRQNFTKVNVYPNPVLSNQLLIIEGISDPATIKLYNFQNQELPIQLRYNNENRLEIETRRLTSGVYLLNTNGSWHKIIIKQY